MSAANDAPDEVCPETKKFPKQGTMLREFAYGSPRQERRRLTPETEASRGGGNTLYLAPHPAAENKDAPPHNDAAGRRGRNRIRRAVNRACYFISTSECPVISAGCSRPISLSTVGATSARMPL